MPIRITGTRNFVVHIRNHDSRHPTRLALVVLALLVLLSLSLNACSSDAAEVPSSTDVTAPIKEDEQAADDADAVDSAPSANRQLVVWLPDFAGYGVEGSAKEVLTGVFHQFEQEHPGVRIDVQVKADTGQSDMDSYLRSTQRVAPSVMPDLVLINSQHLWHLADLGVITPLEWAPDNYSTEFYPFALDAMSYNGEWYGVPFVSDILHSAGYAAQTGDAPENWSELLGQDGEYRFATAGEDIFDNGAVLLQYVGSGGQLMENGSTSSAEALESVFDFLVDGMVRGVIPATVTDFATLDGVWSSLTSDGSGYANVPASRYLFNREHVPELVFSQTPTRNGMPTTLASTWALAIVSQDTEQRELASDLIDSLLNPAVQGAWSQYVHRLPTQRTALPVWANPNQYTDFLNRQLEVAVGIPNGRSFADFASRLRSAQLGVLRGEISPTEAVEAVSGPG